MGPSVSLPRTVPSITLFSLSFVHQECIPPSTLSMMSGVLLFKTSTVFVLSTTGSPLTSETEGTTGAAAISTGFVTAALTDLKSSGTSETVSSTAREMSPPEARESTTFLTGEAVCGLKICFLSSGVAGGCGFETGGGVGAGAATNGQKIGAVGGQRIVNLVQPVCLCESRVGSPFRGQVRRSYKVVTTGQGCTSGPRKTQSWQWWPRKTDPQIGAPTQGMPNACKTHPQRKYQK